MNIHEAQADEYLAEVIVNLSKVAFLCAAARVYREKLISDGGWSLSGNEWSWRRLGNGVVIITKRK